MPAASENSIRVLQVTHSYPPVGVGGVEQHVEGLTAALLGAGHAVTIYTRDGGDGVEGEVRLDTATAPAMGSVRYRYGDVKAFAGLYRSTALDAAFDTFLREAQSTHRFDVAHVHHLTGLSVGVLERLRAARIPTVMTLHDYWMLCARGQMWHRRGELCATIEASRCAECLGTPFGYLLGTDPVASVRAQHRDALHLLGLPDALVVPSARAIPPFAAAGVDPARIKVVENAVDTAALAAVPALRRRPREQSLRVGYLGTVIPSKGLDVLVAACQRLPEGAVSLHVHGNVVPYHGDEGFLTRTLGQLRPSDKFTFHGPYRTGDLPRILAGLDCLVAPARWAEAYGLTPREALAAGRPVIVSRIGGLQDAVSHGIDGLVVAPGDPAELAAALTRLLIEPELGLLLAAAGRKRPRGFDVLAKDLLTVYRSIAKLDRSGTRG